MNNLSFIEQVWLTLIVWFVLIFVFGIIHYFYTRYKNKTFDEEFEKKQNEIKDRWFGQIPPFKNALPPPPELKNAMPRAVAPDAPKRFFGSDEEVEIVRKELEEHLRGMRYNLAGVRKIVFQNGSEMIIPTSALVKKHYPSYDPNENVLSEEEYIIPRDKIDEFLRKRKANGIPHGRYEKNDDGIVVWKVGEMSAPSVSVDFAAPLDPPTYSSDSGSSNSDSSPTDFSGGDFGGGGAGGDY